MTQGDGDGWAGCGQRHRHWGLHGAAGMLVSAPGPRGEPVVLLVRRARWSHHGGTWGTPGGARDSHESPSQAAAREAFEECGPFPPQVRPHAVFHDDHGGWGYHTVVASAPEPFPVRPASLETAQVRWTPASEVSSLSLHPGFAAAWPGLRGALRPVTVIVDGANVVGSRPDGWWRDRAGAALRLRSELERLSAAGVPSLPGDGGAFPALDRWFPEFVLVVEGKARAAWDGRAAEGPVRVAPAPGSGDDAIAGLAGDLPGRRVVVTADQELRGRCLAAGAEVAGPRWLTSLLEA